MVQVCAAGKRTALRAPTCLGVARWRLRPGPRARARGAACRVARCAANMAADGRRVVGVGRDTCCGTCETVRAPQGRNLSVLHAAAAAESRENLLRRVPWHLCIKINPAFRLISSSCARPYLGRLYILQNTSLRWTEHFLPSRVGVTPLLSYLLSLSQLSGLRVSRTAAPRPASRGAPSPKRATGPAAWGFLAAAPRAGI